MDDTKDIGIDMFDHEGGAINIWSKGLTLFMDTNEMKELRDELIKALEV